MLTAQRFTFIIIVILFTSNSDYSYAMSNEELESIIIKYEKKYNIPDKLLLSIAKVESRINPFAVNICGKSYFPKTLVEAQQIINISLNQGITCIDIGLMQINFKYHGKNFFNIQEMLDAEKNLDYAVILLVKLYKIHGSWNVAVQHYHSHKSHLYLKYIKKVLAEKDNFIAEGKLKNIIEIGK